MRQQIVGVTGSILSLALRVSEISIIMVVCVLPIF